MSSQLRVALSALAAFFIAMLLAPAVIKLAKRLKAGQVVLGYVAQHSGKSGTPTIGGPIFVLPAAAVTLIFAYSRFSLIAVCVMLAYAVLGFLDDFIKIKFKQNLGLRAYQKLIGQLGIAAITTYFCYVNEYIGSSINLPFTDLVLNLKWWYLPFTAFVYIAVTNAVNLTDGLDGLASSVGLVYFVAFAAIVYAAYNQALAFGQTPYSDQLLSLTVFCAALVGALAAFMWHNSNPASIMMGDTGSLALGGAAASVAVFSKNPFLFVIIGIMYVVSCISVIVQVLSFKLTGKRVFKMSPYHHHLELSGVAEQKIVWRYAVITAVCAAIAFLA